MPKTGRRNTLHPDFTKQWQSFWDKNPNASRQEVLDNLEHLKNKYSHILKNGKQAAISYGDWKTWLRKLNANRKKAEKTGKVVIAYQKARGPWKRIGATTLAAARKAGKPIAIVTFIYAANKHGCAVAAENTTRDALFPIVDALQVVGEQGEVFVIEAGRNGRLERNRMELYINQIFEDPNGVDLRDNKGR